VQRGWYAHVLGVSPHKFESATEAITKLKQADPKQVNDQFLPPFVVVRKNGQPWGTIEDEDIVINFNFRADRMIQLSKVFVDENFDKFDRVRWPNVRYVAMVQYDVEAKLPVHFLVAPPVIDKLSGKYLCANGIRTFVVRYGYVRIIQPNRPKLQPLFL
jgi:2,3-bisphosphoglycerate-independent phosphoglycerate mutase